MRALLNAVRPGIILCDAAKISGEIDGLFSIYLSRSLFVRAGRGENFPLVPEASGSIKYRY